MLTNIRTQWFRITWLLAGASCLTQGSACSDDKSGEQKGTAVAEAGSSSSKSQSARAGAGGKNTAKAGAGGAAAKPSDDDDEKDKENDSARGGNGAGGSGGKAGNGKAEAGGGGRDAEGNQGGKSAGAGRGGNASSGGSGGSSQMSSTMGEHKEDAACVACEMSPPAADTEKNCVGTRVDNCMKMPGRSMGGALVGEKRSTLCLNLVACMHATKCAYGVMPDTASASDCFCGTGVDPAECKEKPLADLKGACKAEFAAAAESDDPKTVITNALDTSLAVGSAVALLEICDDFFCPVCHGGPAASGTAGSSGMSGGQGGMSAAGTSAAGHSGSAGAH